MVRRHYKRRRQRNLRPGDYEYALKILCCWLRHIDIRCQGGSTKVATYQETHFPGVLKRLGHKIRIVDLHYNNHEQRIAGVVRNWKPDLLFVLPYADRPYFFFIEELGRKAGIPTLLYNMDDQTHWQSGDWYSADIQAKHYDWVMAAVLPNGQSVNQRYGQIGCKCVIPVGFGVDTQKAKRLHIPKTVDVGFYGMPYASRKEEIAQLEEKGAPAVFGACGFTYSRFNEMLNRTRICLNLTRTNTGKVGYKARAIEAAAAGSFVLSQHTRNEDVYFVT